MKREQRPGDWLFVCDLSGMTGWASDSVLTWDNKRVLRRFVGSEAQRHPQETNVAPIRGEGSTPWARPVAEATFRPSTAVTPADL